MDISAILSGVGAALLLISLSNVITIEQLPRCSPIGDTSALINRDYDEVRDWITQNDELIEAIDERRKIVIRLGRYGVTLLIFSYVLQVISAFSMIVGLVLVLYFAYYFLDILHNDEVLRDSPMRKPIVSASILLGITSPFTAYQDVYGPQPIGARVFLIGLSLGAVAYYLRSDIVKVLNTAQQQIAKDPDDLSQDK